MVTSISYLFLLSSLLDLLVVAKEGFSPSESLECGKGNHSLEKKSHGKSWVSEVWNTPTLGGTSCH